MSNVKTKTDLHSATFSLSHKLIRTFWACIYNVFIRFSPVPLFRYRRWVLGLFGCKLASNVNVYPSVKIWLPSNLSIGKGSTLGPNVNVYNQGEIIICENVIVSQGAHLCASTHDYSDPLHPLLLAPITIRDDVWVCTDAFIGPNVDVSTGCVIGARSVLTKSTDEWGVYAGNPSRRVNERKRFY